MTSTGNTGGRASTGRDRGQLVLVAAIALAVALVPLGLAYLQLGYHKDIDTSVDPEPARQITATLDRSVHAATAEVPGHDWDDRTTHVEAIQAHLAPTLETVTTARLADGHVYSVTYNDTRARAWQRNHCPAGPDRQFGPCGAIDGVVVQERDGRTYLLAVAVDLRITTPDGEMEVTTVVPVRST